MCYLACFHHFKHLLFTVLVLFCGLSVVAQQNADTTQLLSVPAYGDTAVINLKIDDFPPTRLSDEEMRVVIMRIMRYGSAEGSMLNDPLLAPNERFYGLFDAQRTPQIGDELLTTKLIREQLQRERDAAKNAGAAGTAYWWLQWLLIFL